MSTRPRPRTAGIGARTGGRTQDAAGPTFSQDRKRCGRFSADCVRLIHKALWKRLKEINIAPKRVARRIGAFGMARKHQDLNRGRQARESHPGLSPEIAQALHGMKWNERLEAARAMRAKILAEREGRATRDAARAPSGRTDGSKGAQDRAPAPQTDPDPALDAPSAPRPRPRAARDLRLGDWARPLRMRLRAAALSCASGAGAARDAVRVWGRRHLRPGTLGETARRAGRLVASAVEGRPDRRTTRAIAALAGLALAAGTVRTVIAALGPASPPEATASASGPVADPHEAFVVPQAYATEDIGLLPEEAPAPRPVMIRASVPPAAQQVTSPTSPENGAAVTPLPDAGRPSDRPARPKPEGIAAAAPHHAAPRAAAEANFGPEDATPDNAAPNNAAPEAATRSDMAGAAPPADDADPAPQERMAQPEEAPRVLVFFQTGLDPARITTATEALAAAGLETVPPSPVSFRVKQDQVRFFRPEDRSAARLVGEATGAAVRDFTDYRPRPPSGTMELWLSGS